MTERPCLARRAFLLLLTLGVVEPAFKETLLSCAAVAAEPLRFSIAIKDRKVDESYKTLRVTQGAAVELIFTTDEAAELHLHGYDKVLTVTPAAPGELRLLATIAGRFPLEAHQFGGSAAADKGRRQAHVVLMYLEVYPR